MGPACPRPPSSARSRPAQSPKIPPAISRVEPPPPLLKVDTWLHVISLMYEDKEPRHGFRKKTPSQLDLNGASLLHAILAA